MGELEREVMDRRLRDLGCVGDGAESSPHRRFRINAGQGWIASPAETLHPSRPMTVRVYPGEVILHHARVFIGAPEGWPDLAGWDSVIITPEMIGNTIAVFAGDEAKTEHVKLSKVQKIFRDVILRMGGRYEVIR